MIKIPPPTIWVASCVKAQPAFVVRQLHVKDKTAFAILDVFFFSFLLLLKGVGFTVFVFHDKFLFTNVLVCLNAPSFVLCVNVFKFLGRIVLQSCSDYFQQFQWSASRVLCLQLQGDRQKSALTFFPWILGNFCLDLDNLPWLENRQRQIIWGKCLAQMPFILQSQEVYSHFTT